ncbi:CD44 antigen [Oryzias melastigma]|uniref:CD44 antigen-like n=1 Tax=Oryzias melastigma TaxID=30732 RepID=A0A3B3BMH0_ORYME|nr:CD44 antigen [Oryzias melastigma]
MMARLCIFCSTFLLSLAGFSEPSESSLDKVIPQSYTSSGVFLLIEGGEYTLNFTAARDACLSLNVTMATKAQMERAIQHGLETCKYGWIAEMIAVVPRLKSDKFCGKGNTGVVSWNAPSHRKFAVFCFNSSVLENLEQHVSTSTVNSKSVTSSSRLRTPSTSPAARTLRSTPPPPTPTAGSHRQASSASTSSALVQTTSGTSSSPPPPLLIMSTSSEDSFTFLTSAQTSGPSLSSASEQPKSNILIKYFPAVIIALVGVFLLMAAGAVQIHKWRRSGWYQQQKDDEETEMWKSPNSEMDLQSEHGAELELGEEELQLHRKFSSQMTLCVNPQRPASLSE